MKRQADSKPTLKLARETIRVLSSSDLGRVVGGTGGGDDCTEPPQVPCRLTTWLCPAHCGGGETAGE